jgi:riboflavin synthase
MFTGLIEATGVISRLRTRSNYRILTIASELTGKGLAPGESISCDGACLTVVSAGKDSFEVEASQETLRRTIAGAYTAGTRINLERALQVGSRLGGHFVSGHIDDTGTVDYVRSVGESRELAVRYDGRFDRLVVDKGSIAINGVSLTVNATRPGRFTVNLVPYTVNRTTLGSLKAGDGVNLEFDLIGKYILKLHGAGAASKLTREKLIESGW